MPFQFYKAGHFSPSFSLSHAHIELEPMKSYTTAAKLFNINSVEQYKEKSLRYLTNHCIFIVYLLYINKHNKSLYIYCFYCVFFRYLASWSVIVTFTMAAKPKPVQSVHLHYVYSFRYNSCSRKIENIKKCTTCYVLLLW